MKKIYKQPETLVMNIVTDTVILAGSPGKPGAGIGGGEVGAGDIESKKGFTLWDDNFDEE